MERTLLGAGDVRANLARLTAIAFSGSAIQSALPVGAAFAGVYEFRQFQLLGADEVLAGWVVIAVGAVAFATLAALAGVGLALAATLGSTFDLVYAIVGVLFIALLAVLAWANRSTGYRLALRATARLERALKRSPGQLSGPLDKGVQRMRSVAPTRLEWAQAVLAGTCSWLSDCSCLAFAFIAVGAGVPWAGLLLAYCGGQLAVNLPITPGGLGVVEGSLTVALVAFGGGEAPTVAAVLLCRCRSGAPATWACSGPAGARRCAARSNKARPQDAPCGPERTGQGRSSAPRRRRRWTAPEGMQNKPKPWRKGLKGENEHDLDKLGRSGPARLCGHRLGGDRVPGPERVPPPEPACGPGAVLRKPASRRRGAGRAQGQLRVPRRRAGEPEDPGPVG
jgi:uncharacterized protein (TIRG00374 family)